MILPLSPAYWALVREEADYLMGACGPTAQAYCLNEAEDALSPAWTAFMRRVRKTIAQREGARVN